MALFYEAADAIRHIRHPASFGYEMDDVERMEGESEKDFEARKKASVVFHRHQQYQELFSKLHASRYRFMAQISKDEAQPFDDIRKLTNQILIAARMLARLWAREHFRTDEQWNRHLDEISRHEAVFWEGLEEDDPIKPKLDQIMADIEGTCKRVIEGQASLRSVLSKRLRWRQRN